MNTQIYFMSILEYFNVFWMNFALKHIFCGHKKTRRAPARRVLLFEKDFLI